MTAKNDAVGGFSLGYFLKMKLISEIFGMSGEEQSQMKAIIEFILPFHARYWFTTPLAISTARQNLDIMSSMFEYRKVSPQLSCDVLGITYRHLWYLTPQLITLALKDTGLEDNSREKGGEGASQSRE